MSLAEMTVPAPGTTKLTTRKPVCRWLAWSDYELVALAYISLCIRINLVIKN